MNRKTFPINSKSWCAILQIIMWYVIMCYTSVTISTHVHVIKYATTKMTKHTCTHIITYKPCSIKSDHLCFLSTTFPNVGHILIQIILLCSLWTFLMFHILNYKIWGTLQDQSHGCPRAHTVTNRTSWISKSSTKSLDSGESSSFVWLQEDDSLNTRWTFLIADVMSCYFWKADSLFAS